MLLLLAVSAIIIARWAERHSHVLTVVHSIYFIVLSACLFFTSDSSLIVQAGNNIVGEYAYGVMRDAISTPATVLSFAYSAYMVVEVGVVLSLAAATAQSIISGAGKALARVLPGKRSVKCIFAQREAGNTAAAPCACRYYLKFGRLMN